MFSCLAEGFEFSPAPCRALTLDEAIGGWKRLSDTVEKLVPAGKRVSMENKVLKEENKDLKEALRKLTAELAESESALRLSLESIP